jgi:hypothetical protein
MTIETITTAQSLRVIGQQLTRLGIDSFEVEKSGDEYVVQMHRGEANGKSRTHAFLNSVSQEIRRSPDSTTQSPNPIHLRPAQILQADEENRSRRDQPTAIPDPYKLSTLLRVLGDYLDRKRADEFAIVYDTTSLTVKYDQKSESLRIDTLYDLGVHMYLRRSNRDRAR